MTLELWQWAVLGFASALFGIAKTAIGGLGILPVAIFAGMLPARESVGVVLVVLIVADLVAVTVYRRHADWSQLLRLFPWTVIGILAGTFTLGRVDDVTAQRLIGGIVVTMVLIRWYRDWRGARDDEPEDEEPHPRLAMAMGIVAGFTSMVANAAGPIMVLYLLAMRLPKMAFVGTIAWFFLAVNLFKVPFLASLGLIHVASIGASLALWPFAIGGALLGRWMIGHINQRRFESISLALAAIAGARLLFG